MKALGASERLMKRRLNGRTLLVLLTGGALLGIGVHVLHGRQVRRAAPALLERAGRLEADERPDDAAFYLQLYLRRVPGDADAWARLVRLRARLARDPK